MGKRLTSTNKWDKAWFRKLSPRHKSLWQFLTDRCDQAGIWEIDFESASHFINDTTPITEEDLKAFGNRVEKYDSEKLWIVDFVSFQCGELSQKCPAHKPVFKLLRKYNLLDRVLNRLSNSLQEIEKEIEREEEKEKQGVHGEITLSTDALKLTNDICEYFSVKTIVTSKIYNSVCEFVNTMAYRNEVQIAAMSLKNYIAYKARSKETIHNVSAWIGSLEHHFQDGQWIMIDWDAKNKNFKENDRQANKGTSSATGSVIEGGKAFGDLRSRNSR